MGGRRVASGVGEGGVIPGRPVPSLWPSVIDLFAALCRGDHFVTRDPEHFYSAEGVTVGCVCVGFCPSGGYSGKLLGSQSVKFEIQCRHFFIIRGC